MLAAAVATALLVFAQTYEQFLVAALGAGLAGGVVCRGRRLCVAVLSAEQARARALGIFGVGNVGAAVTKFVAPFVMVALGWQAVALAWAAALAIMAVVFWFSSEDDPVLVKRRREGAPQRSLAAEFALLRDIRVWRFGLYYFFSFGAFVALTLLAAALSDRRVQFRHQDGRHGGCRLLDPASIFRAYGGTLSDKVGARDRDVLDTWRLGRS